MESYVRNYTELLTVQKRKKLELIDIQSKLNASKQRLYTTMVKYNIDEINTAIKVNGVEEKVKINREKIKPAEKLPRKKKGEVLNDIQIVLEEKGIEKAEELAKELECVRKSKGEHRPNKNTGVVEYN